MRENWIYRRGDIYMANLNPFKGSEQGGTRPVVVLQNDIGNFYCPTLIVAPLTSRLEKNELPTHYRVRRAKSLPAKSIVLLEQIKTIDKQRIKHYLGKLPSDEMKEVDKLMRISLGLFYK